MRRKNDYSSRENCFREKIRVEHDLFRFEMLSNNRREIYESCNKIRFYESLYEYFLYKEVLDIALLEAGLQTDDLLGHLYHLYLKYEWFDIGTWEQIEEFLRKFLSIYQRETDAGLNNLKRWEE